MAKSAKRASKSALKSAPKKKKPVRLNKSIEGKYMGDEPDWFGSENWTPEQIHREKTRGMNWYNYFNSAKELKKDLYLWMKQSEFPADDIKAARAVPDNRLNPVVMCIARMLNNGMPDSESAWMRDKLAEMLEEGRAKLKATAKTEKKAKNAYVPSIQDRMKEQLSEFIGEIDSWEDNFFADTKSDIPKLFEWLKSKNVAQVHIKKIKDYYQPKLDEMNELAKGTDIELAEGFKFLKKVDVKRVIGFYDSLMHDLDAYANLKKVTRKIRTKKAPTASKLVAKLKFKTEDKDLKLISIRPTDIVGSRMLWLYNCKTRKLFEVHADEGCGQLTVKGTTIIGYDEQKSFGKTIRKPEEKLKEFSKCGKVKLRSFMADINAVSIKFNGRVNKDMILMKVQ